MKYHGHIIEKVIDEDVMGGCYWLIYRMVEHVETIYTYNKDKDGIVVEKSHKSKWFSPHHVTNAWTLSNAKEFIDSYDGNSYNWNILC